MKPLSNHLLILITVIYLLLFFLLCRHLPVCVKDYWSDYVIAFSAFIETREIHSGGTLDVFSCHSSFSVDRNEPGVLPLCAQPTLSGQTVNIVDQYLFVFYPALE